MKSEMVKDMNILKGRLGRTGFEISVLGLGGHTYQVDDDGRKLKHHENRARLISHLISSGVNYFDTTWIHEVKLLSDSFKRAGVKGQTFVSLQYVDGISDPHWPQKLRREIEVRLTIMGYTYAPLFLMGMGNRNVAYTDVLAACEAMAKLKEEGLIQNLGISCHTINLFPLITRVIQETDLLDYIMIRFNLKFQQANETLFPTAKKHDVGIIVMKVFCWNCGPNEWDKPIGVFEPVPNEHRTANSQSLTPAQQNLLWCIKNSPCDMAVVAMNSLWEFDQNIKALHSMS
jgi:predicted aldo/keto reductase-like oxidoreductase